MRRAAVLLLCLLAVVLAAPTPAYAHGRLVESTPANGATVREPVESVSLAFTEKLPQFAFVSVTAPNGVRVDEQWSHAAPFRLAKPVREYQLVAGVWQPQDFQTGFPVRVPVAHWPEHGQYVVRYQSVATDGEEVEGEVRFTYGGSVIAAPPGWQAPTSQPSPELLAAVGKVREGGRSQPAASAPAPAAAAQPAPPSGGRGPWPWLVPVLLVVAVAGLILLWRTGPAARRKSAPAARGKSGSAARGKSGPAAREKSGPAAREKSGPAAREKSGPAARGKSGSVARGKAGPAARENSGKPSRRKSG